MKILVIIIFLAFLGESVAQTFQKKLDYGEASTSLHSVKHLREGGYIAVGSTMYSEGLFILLAESGDIRSAFTVSDSSHKFACGFNSIDQTTDGGFIALGGSRRNFTDITITKIDPNGNIEWSSIFGGNEDDYPVAITQTSDGGCALTATFGITSSHNKVVVVKLASDGSLKWSSVVSDTSANISGEVMSVLEMKDSTLIICGYQKHNSKDQTSFVAKLDKNGTPRWRRAVGTMSKDMVFGMTVTTDGGIVLVGQTRSSTVDLYVLKLSKDGDIVWTKIIDALGVEQGYTAVEKSDSSLLITGIMSSVLSNPGTDSLFIAGLTKNGDFLFFKTATFQLPFTAGVSLARGIDDNVVVSGYMVGSIEGISPTYSAILSGFDKNSDNCSMRDLLCVVSSAGTIWDSSFSVTSFPIELAPLSYISKPVTVAESDLCALSLVPPDKPKSSIAVFPNPSNPNEDIFIHIGAGLPRNQYRVVLYDLLGNCVYREDKVISGSEQTISIQPIDLSSGIYTVELVDASSFTSVWRGKVVKVK